MVWLLGQVWIHWGSIGRFEESISQTPPNRDHLGELRGFLPGIANFDVQLSGDRERQEQSLHPRPKMTKSQGIER